MKLDKIGLSHRGRRSNNEDNILVEELDGEVYLLAVADGMGGHLAGERASGTAIEELVNAARSWDRQRLEPQAFLIDTIKRINKRLYVESSNDKNAAGMGTTLSAALIVDGLLYVTNVGDSRVYLLDASGMEQITVDHSLVQQGLEKGVISEEEASTSPFAHALTRAVGTDDDVEVDVFPADGAGRRLESGSIVFLSSDGLHGSVKDLEIEHSFKSTADLNTGCIHLQSLAYTNGSSDNISLVALEFGEYQRSKEPIEPLPPISSLLNPEKQRRPRLSIVAWSAIALSILLLGLIIVTVYLFADFYYREPGMADAAQNSGAAQSEGAGGVERNGESVQTNGDEKSAFEVEVDLSRRSVRWTFDYTAYGLRVEPGDYQIVILEDDREGARVLNRWTFSESELSIDLIKNRLYWAGITPDSCCLVVSVELDGKTVSSQPVNILLK